MQKKEKNPTSTPVSKVSEGFIMKPAYQFLQEESKPIPKKLYGSLWYENEWAILFGDTNADKSILAVQIADAISRGNSGNDLFKVDVPAQPVLYIDLELSNQEFKDRYSDTDRNHYTFAPNLIRATLDYSRMEGFKFLFTRVLDSIEEGKIKILIIDNLNNIYNDISVEENNYMCRLLNLILSLKYKHGLSILTLMHTPKRDKSQPITDSKLAGSKMFSNFCDSLFAIGVSCKDESTKYIKQVKVRTGEHEYGSENVIICKTEKPNNFLQFTFGGSGSERDQLKALSEKDKLEAQILDMIIKNPDASHRKIANDLGVHYTKVARIAERNVLKK